MTNAANGEDEQQPWTMLSLAPGSRRHRAASAVEGRANLADLSDRPP